MMKSAGIERSLVTYRILLRGEEENITLDESEREKVKEMEEKVKEILTLSADTSKSEASA